MQGGLVNPAGDVSVTTVGETGGRMPSVTGAPTLPSSQSEQAQTYEQPQVQASPGDGPGVTTSTTIAELGPVDRLLAGTEWSRADVELALQTLSTLILLYWAITEVQ